MLEEPQPTIADIERHTYAPSAVDAVYPNDYTGLPNYYAPLHSGWVTMADGQAYADITLAALEDRVTDPEESVSLKLAVDASYGVSRRIDLQLALTCGRCVAWL